MYYIGWGIGLLLLLAGLFLAERQTKTPPLITQVEERSHPLSPEDGIAAVDEPTQSTISPTQPTPTLRPTRLPRFEIFAAIVSFGPGGSSSDRGEEQVGVAVAQGDSRTGRSEAAPEIATELPALILQTTTPLPTATATATPLPTDTPIPTATDTPLPTPTNTLVPTVPPTVTPLPTAVPLPTEPPPPTGYYPPPRAQAEPVAEADEPAPAPTLVPPPTPVPNLPAVDPITLISFPADIDVRAEDVGIQLHLHAEDIEAVLNQLEELNVGWVKLQVAWKTFEPERDKYDENWFGELDRFIHLANGRGIKIMLSVAKAPEWSRPTTELDGPPSDFTHFERFMRDLTARYTGNVHAYELWNEPNLMREWNGMPLSAEEFVALMRYGAAGVRAADPNVIIISGAPATTGVHDGINAIDDRVYFERMLAAGVGDFVDGIGVHPYGWANPPDALIDQPVAGVSSHNDHTSFFFAHTMADYLTLMDRYQVDSRLWVTEFGWGSFETFLREPTPEAVFMREVSERQQADYLETALKIGEHQDQIGPMMVWNLNFGPLLGEKFSESGYSLIHPDGSKRPAYERLKTLLNN